MILGVIDHDRGSLDPLSLQMLTFGRRLAEPLGLPLHAVVLGDEAKELARRLECSIRQSSATRSDFRMISCFGSQGR